MINPEMTERGKREEESEAQTSEDKSSEFLGEPTIPEEKKGFPIKRTIAGGLGTISLTAAGLLGLNKINSEDNGSERPGVIITDSTLEPATQPPMFTPEATPEPIITKEPEKSPYEFSWETNIGDTTIRIEDKLATRTECPDPNSPVNNAGLVACSPMIGVEVDTVSFPDANDVNKRLENGITFGLYKAWQNADKSRKNITFEEYKSKISSGEELEFTARGFQGESFLPSDIIISSNDKVFIDYIASPLSIIRPHSSAGMGYRKINDEIHIELFDFTSGDLNTRNHSISLVGNLASALAYLSFPEIQTNGKVSDQGSIDELLLKMFDYLAVKQNNGSYNGIIVSR